MASADPPLDVEALLAPIRTEQPAGADLRYESVYDEIKTARRAADDKRQGRSAYSDADDQLSADERASAAHAYWREVRDLVVDVLKTESKDVQLAVWLLEAEAYLRGFPGAGSGFQLIGRLLDTYWDTIYPAIQDDDEPLAFRVGALEWISEKLPDILKGLPLSPAPRKYGLADYDLAEKATDATKKAELAASGRPTLQQFTQAMTAASGPHLEALESQLNDCLAQLNGLEKVTDVRVVQPAASASGRPSPLLSFGPVRKVLEDGLFQVGRALRAKGLRSADGGSPAPAVAGGAESSGGAPATGDAVWDRALQLVAQGQLEGLRLGQQHIDAASSGRERFLRQLQLSELCIQAGMHVFAYPILDDLGRTIEQRDLANWEEREVVRRTWAGLVTVCKALSRLRPDSAAREAEAQRHLTELVESGNAPSSES